MRITADYIVLLTISFSTLCTVFTGCTYDCERFIEMDVRRLEIHGEVVEKEISFTSNRVRYLENGASKNLQVYTEYDGMPFIHFVEQGDSIFKNPGSLEFKVQRGTSVKVFEFNCNN